ncbi:MAG: tetratricopeptide repeat protein [Selenomonadaceae bacterium]|nr:tetratricopeptide repeat protein [Selenomonadaceae bacterium]
MKKILAAAVVVSNLIFSSAADAEVKVYTATAEDLTSAFESEEVGKLRALDKAIKLAATQAAADLKNFQLSDDEIAAIIAGGYELGAVNYNKAGTAWQATAEIKIDDAEVKNFLRRDDREKFTLISQAREIEKIYAANEKRVENLRKRAEEKPKLKSEERKFFRAEFEYVTNEFLSNRKIAAGNKYFYRGRNNDALIVYKEATELNEYNAAAYNLRGNLYNILALNEKMVPIADSNRRQSINDLDKAIRLNNNYAEAFSNRGFVYLSTKLSGQAVKDFNRAIQLAPNNPWNYIYRAQCLRATDKAAALADFNKAVELAPNAIYVYSERGNFFEDEKEFSKALEDYTRAIELDKREEVPALNLYNRAGVYQKMNMSGRAIDDYTRAIQLLESQSQKNPLLPWVYRKRGECYQALGDGARAQADFKKFADLQRR